MVKVRGPMFSLGASGSLADAVTFSINKGRPYVRERVMPSQPKSGGQVGRRAAFKFLTENWTNLDPATPPLWQPLADELVTAPFNAYMKTNMENWHNFLAPFHRPADPRTGTTGDVVLTAAAWEENRIKLTMLGAGAQQNDGIIIYASTTGAFTPAVGNAILFHRHHVATSTSWYWTPPSVTRWYFNSMQFTDDGNISAAGGQQDTGP